jgi:hypothetical protein
MIDNKIMLKGMIKGMQDMGATFVKSDDFDIFFNIKIGSKIDDDTKLKRAKNAFMKSFGIGLKIKRIS